jgi:hypothetical protein
MSDPVLNKASVGRLTTRFAERVEIMAGGYTVPDALAPQIFHKAVADLADELKHKEILTLPVFEQIVAATFSQAVRDICGDSIPAAAVVEMEFQRHPQFRAVEKEKLMGEIIGEKAAADSYVNSRQNSGGAWYQQYWQLARDEFNETADHQATLLPRGQGETP